MIWKNKIRKIRKSPKQNSEKWVVTHKIYPRKSFGPSTYPPAHLSANKWTVPYLQYCYTSHISHVQEMDLMKHLFHSIFFTHTMYFLSHYNCGVVEYTLCIFFIRIYFIRISRLRFGSIFLAVSRNIQLELYLNVRKESFHPEMQFKAVFEECRGGKFEK